MISYESMDFPHIVRFKKDGADNMKKEAIIELKTASSDAKTVEHQLKFSDFRSVGGSFIAISLDGKLSAENNRKI